MPPSPHEATSPTGQPSAYTARINRVVDHISTHLADTLDLQTLAEVAHFSPWHFHRVFQGMTGETLADCVRRLRLEAAAQRLLGTPPLPALHVAIDTGFASAAVFSRAFRLHFGMTPTEWRRGRWRDWAAHHYGKLSKIHQADRKNYQTLLPSLFKDGGNWPVGPVANPEGRKMHVELRTLPPARLAYMRNTGPYGPSGIGQLWQRFAAWCGGHGLMNPRRQMYGISQDNPEITPAAKCRYDACVGVGEDFSPEGDVGVQDFAGGRYACGRFTGKAGEDVHKAWTHMFAEWLPGSGYQADNKPALELYEEDFVMDPATGVFTCLLCVPVRAL